MSKVGLHWFRHGLRLHDNAPLLKAAETCSHLIALYVLDPGYLQPGKVSANRLGFLLDSLVSLDSDLQSKGSKLFVAKGNPCDVIGALIKQHNVTVLTFERDTEPYNKAVDEKLMKLSEDISVHAMWGHTMFDPEYLLSLNNGQPPLTMTSFLSLMSLAGEPPKPRDSPLSIPPPPSQPLQGVLSAVPSLNDLPEYGLKMEEKTTWFVAGEAEAIKVMENFMAQKNRVAKFEKPNTEPTALEPDTTALSPYVTRGSLSSRLFYHKLKETLNGRSSSKPPVSLKGQLYWREMAYLIGFATPNFNKMSGNPICKQIPWREGEETAGDLGKWELGQTGYPAVDAVMNQLRTEGWMHHLARHLVACFLTRGDLWISWELGRDVFEKYLVDADWSINNFSWHWLSCSAFFHQYFRCYSPIAFFKKKDPNGNYIRKHVPILAKFPAEYIYEPWTAPRGIQTACGCEIGKDYPKPIVDHSKVVKVNMSRMKSAYDEAKGESPRKQQKRKLKQNDLTDFVESKRNVKK